MYKRHGSHQLHKSCFHEYINAEIEGSEGEEALDPDVDEELYVQLAGSKSEAEVGDEEVCRPALVPSGEGR